MMRPGKRPATAHRDFLENGRIMTINPDRIYFDMDKDYEINEDDLVITE